MSAARTAATRAPRLQRQTSVLHEIQESQERDSLETRYTRLMMELSGLCSDRNHVLTAESLQHLATAGRAEPVKLEREPEKPHELLHKSGKHDELLHADAARRQRVEELTRFFMEAKSDIEFALGGGGSREFREARDRERDGESEREGDERGNETGDDDDAEAATGAEDVGSEVDPARELARLHASLLRDKIDDRVYNGMLARFRETDAALYGAILCHPLVTGVDPKRDRRKKKKRKDRERKDKTPSSAPSNVMLTPDFTSTPLTHDEMRLNIARFVARAVSDGSIQGLLLASQLVLSWIATQEESSGLTLPLASHLRVLRGEKPPEIPPPKVEAPATDSKNAKTDSGNLQAASSDADSNSNNTSATAMEMDTEGDSLSSLRVSLNRLGEGDGDGVGQTERGDEDQDIVHGNAEEGVDEDALMARAIALSLSPDMSTKDQSDGAEDTSTTVGSAETADRVCPQKFSPQEIIALGPFLLPLDGTDVEALSVVMCLLAETNRHCLDYLESCQKGILPCAPLISPHPLTFMLMNSLMRDLLAEAPVWTKHIDMEATWRLFVSCSKFSVLRCLEANLFHVEVNGIPPASVGLGQALNDSGHCDTNNRLVEGLKLVVEKCISTDMSECCLSAAVNGTEKLVFSRVYTREVTLSVANLYNEHAREQALSSWGRGVAHFYPSQVMRHKLLVEMLEECAANRRNGSKNRWKFYQLDLLCARLSLPDLAQGFVPTSGDVVLSTSSVSDRQSPAVDNSSSQLLDDSIVQAAAQKTFYKVPWNPKSIREALAASTLTPRALLDYLVASAPTEFLDAVGISSLVLTEGRASDILVTAYEKLWADEKRQEQAALECINRLPLVMDLLRESVLDDGWLNLSYGQDFSGLHAPLVPVWDNLPRSSLKSRNSRILLLRSLQDLLIDRIGGSRDDDIPSLEFDPSRCAETMTLTDGNKTARQYTAKQWGMVMATTGCPPNTGVHEWAVRLDRCEKGHIFLGVCTRDASVATYVGGDRQGWGLIGTRALWHNRSKVRGDYGDGFSTGSIVRVRLNTDTGALSFGVDDSDWGIAFDGLTQHGTLYPAIGLYQRDDQVTILPVLAQESSFPDLSAGAHNANISVPAVLQPFLCHAAAVFATTYEIVKEESFQLAVEQSLSTLLPDPVQSYLANKPIVCQLLTPLLSSLSTLKGFYGLTSLLALKFIPWCTQLVQLLDKTNQAVRTVCSNECDFSVDVTGEWELKSMAAGSIPAQQYHLVLNQEQDGSVSGKSSGSFTTVTLSGAVIGTKVRFVETWRQGGTCLVEGRLRADGYAFTGTYEDAKSHTSGSIVGRKILSNSSTSSTLNGPAQLLILEVVSANLVGLFSRALIDSSRPDIVVDKFAPSLIFDEEIVNDGPNVVDADGAPKTSKECSNDEYEGWVNSLLLSGGLPAQMVKGHLDDVLKKLKDITTIRSKQSPSYDELSSALNQWLRFVTPKAVMSVSHDCDNTGSEQGFLRELINAIGDAAVLDRWVSRHVGESPFLRLGGEPMKVAKRTVCAAMIWHSGFLPAFQRILSAEIVDSEERPHENLMHIWRASQRVIEWAIRAKNSMGSTYAVVAALVIRKAEFLLSIEPSARASAASAAVAMMSQESISNSMPPTKITGYDCVERVFSEVLMQVSRFLEAPIRISSLQSRMLAHSTRAFLRTLGMLSFRYFVGDATGPLGAVNSSFALSGLLQWLSPALAEHAPVMAVSTRESGLDGNESATSAAISGTESLHYTHGIGGCGKFLKEDLRDAFEALYSLLSATLSKATWAHDVDLQLVVLEAWGIAIQPDDHSFLSRVGVFRVLQTVLDEARGNEVTIDGSSRDAAYSPEARIRIQELRRKVVQAALKVVHLLAAQVAHAGETMDTLEVPAESSQAGIANGLGSIPLLRKPSGPETLGKSVFHMLYTELKNALVDIREQPPAGSDNSGLHAEPTDAEPSGGSERSTADAEEYCYQICSLLYSVSGSPVCRSHISSSRWLRLLLALLDSGNMQIQRRSLKLLRRLLPELDPAAIRLVSGDIDAIDMDSDDDVDVEDLEDQAEILIQFFFDIVGTMCPPSLAEGMLAQEAHFVEAPLSKTPAKFSNGLANEVILLLRSLYQSARWSSYMSAAVVSALSNIPGKDQWPVSTVIGGSGDSDVEMEEPSKEVPSVGAWRMQNRRFLTALSALAILDGHTDGLHVGSTVKILPRSGGTTTQELSLRGARGVVVSYEPEKSTAEVLIRPGRSTDSTQSSQSYSPSRPVRVPVEDVVAVPEVELDISIFSDAVLKSLLVDNFSKFVEEIKKNTPCLPDVVDDAMTGNQHALVDDDDEMSNDGSSPGGLDNEMTGGACDESDADSEAQASHIPGPSSIEPGDVASEISKESQLHRMLLCQHGLRAMASLLRDERAAETLINGTNSARLVELLEIAISDTPTGGLSEISTLEESWVYLWSRWYMLRQAKASPMIPKTSEGGVEPVGKVESDLAPNPMVQQMMEMGFPKEWCEVALTRCSHNVEAAINYCFEHSNDMERLVAQHKASKHASEGSGGRGTKPDNDAAISPLLEQLAEMGFPLTWCKKALAANRNNVDAALTWILSNGEALEAQDRREQEVSERANEEGGEASSNSEVAAADLLPNPLRSVSGQASISERDLMVEGLVGGGFASVGAPDCLVYRGRWYYEATLHTNGCIQIGWADVAFCGAADRGDGVGDGAHSWAYDGWRQQKWHGQSSPWGSKWKQGDVVGCGVDADAGVIIFSLNGKMKSVNMGVAFRGIQFAHGLYPCASFNRRERLQFNLGGTPFTHSPPPGFRPIIEVLCGENQILRDLPRGFLVHGIREDCLEESIGEENYTSDFRYFGRDGHATIVRTSGSHHSRGSVLLGQNRSEMFSELKAIPDERIYGELILLTRSLAILHARRALLTLLSKWPIQRVGEFRMSFFTHRPHGQEDEAASRFIDFIKLMAGLSGNSGYSANGSGCQSLAIDEQLDQCVSGRVTLHLLVNVARSAVDDAVTKSQGARTGLLDIVICRIKNEVDLASDRQYARVPWDLGDTAVIATLLQIASESGQPWSDKEIQKHPNVFLAEWLSRLVIDALARHQNQLPDAFCDEIRLELLRAWATALKSPGLCVKEKASTIVSGVIQDILLRASSSSTADVVGSSSIQRLTAVTVKELSLSRLLDLADERLHREYSHLPVCSRYLQSMIELISAVSLASMITGRTSDSLFTRDCSLQLKFSRQLEEDLYCVDQREYELVQEERRLRAAEDAAKEAAAQSANNAVLQDEVTDGPQADDQMQDVSTEACDAANQGGNMDVDSDSEGAPDITLTAIANMVAEDSDVVAAAAAIAAAARGRLSIRQAEKSNDQQQPVPSIASEFEFKFPEEKIVFDVSMLDEEEKLMLDCANSGVMGTESLQWIYGSELGVLSDSTTSIWSGQVTQFKLREADADEVFLPELTVGCKVIRGPSWKWRDQDGGEGSIGTVEGVSPWSGVEGEGMSVRWPNDALYTYRWGADGNFDLTHVEVDDSGNIVKHYPTPRAKTEDEGSFGCELHLGVLLHLHELDEDNTSTDQAKRVRGLLEWPDYGAAVIVTGFKYPDSSLCIQELQMIRGNTDMGWSLRFGSERWQPGTKYTLRPATNTSGSSDCSMLRGEFSHMARKQGGLVEVRGEISLSTKHLFTMDPYNHFSTLSITDEGMTVTCNSGESRNLALGTVGFATGIHYWEVRVDQAEFGSVFIGVCEKPGPPGSQAALSSRLNRWHGWGFVNFRATYHNSTERIYGDHFNAGDTIGVRLDMEQGKLSFFMDGMKFGEHIVADLGVAFEHMKGERNSKTLYPCIGMRKSGDRVALNGKWISLPGISQRQLLRDAIDVSSSIHQWYLSVQRPQSRGIDLSADFLLTSWKEWKRWSQLRWRRYPVRPRGVYVDFDTYPSSCIAVSKSAGLDAPFLAGDRVRICAKYGRELNQPEEAVILGVYRNHLWYRTETQGNEGADEGRSWAWYFSSTELAELLLVRRNGKDMTLIENSALDVSESMTNEGAFIPRTDAEVRAFSDFNTFVKLATHRHTALSDMQLVERLNSYCASIGVDVTNLQMNFVTTPEESSGADSTIVLSKPSRAQFFIPDEYFSTPALKSLTGPELRARTAVLRVLNGKLSRVLPLIALQPSEPSSDIIEVGNHCNPTASEYPSTSLKLRSLRRLIFTTTKRAFWDEILRATTTSTPLPSDEYEDPREIRVIRINRIQAQASKLSLLAQPSDRLRRSVFGQLYREMRTWNDGSFRRAYCGKGHGGQRRAFKVKFLGEGVNDYGGPYRAVFEQIVDELQMDNVELSKGEQGLLPLLIPCPNRRSGTGSNQDKFLLNPSCGASPNSSGPIALDLHRFLGKIVGTGVRHGLQMGLDLPSLVWRPLAGLEINRAHLESVDIVAANNLTRVEEVQENGPSDALEFLTFSTTLSDGSEVLLCPNGDQVAVTVDNRLEYVSLVEKTRLTESAQQLAALRDGLASVLPMELAHLFTPRELEVLICGRREVDVDLLQQCTEYGEGVDDAMPHVQAFWEVLREMSSDERTLFLRFVWARSRMPNSAKDFPMNFKIQSAHDSGAQVDPDKYLPHAQTCFFALRLPAYTSKDALRDKLLYAIQNSPNMDADVRLHNAEGWADA